MTIIFLLVQVLMYNTGDVYTNGPWIFQNGEACDRAQQALNLSHNQSEGMAGGPIRTAWACIRLVQP